MIFTMYIDEPVRNFELEQAQTEIDVRRSLRNKLLMTGLGGAAIGLAIGIISGDLAAGAGMAAGAEITSLPALAKAQQNLNHSREKVDSIIRLQNKSARTDSAHGILLLET